MIWASPKKRLPVTIALLLGLIVIGTILGHTHGPKPDAGATYTGTVVVETPSGAIIRDLPIAFDIDASGHAVGSVRFPRGLPSTCAGRDLGEVSRLMPIAPIRTPSRFNVSLAIRTTPTSRQVLGTLEISGVFHSFHREAGAVRTTFFSSALRRCGVGAGYTAKS